MSEEALGGLTATLAMFDRLPRAAREELGVELALLGREGLAMQKAETPVDTGALQAGLSLQVMLDQLKIRMGLLGIKAGQQRKLFYGIIVYFGRAAQTVVVQRRKRVNGMLRLSRRRKRAEDIVATYALKVKPLAGIPYIDAPGDDFDQLTQGQLAEYWDRTLARAEAGS